LTDIGNAFEEETNVAYGAFSDKLAASKLDTDSPEFAKVSTALQNAALAIVAKLADQVVDGALDDAVDTSIVVSENANKSFVQSPVLGNLYSYTVDGMVNGCTDADPCDVDVDLTIDFLFEGLSGAPSGSAPADGPTTLNLSNLHMNITTGVASADGAGGGRPLGVGQRLPGG